MSSDSPIIDSKFRQIKHLSRADNRGRLTVGAVAKEKSYRIMINESGQILLDPIVTMPSKELWLWHNQSAQESLKRGLQEAESGNLYDLGSFAEYAELDPDE
ncbi:MAG: hypothetical protein QNJ72_27905 [Pleurocapsa sp. MO_226.B13]|nr:hypothetical protein [Pleurocapsa sp. MO_226.B13]